MSIAEQVAVRVAELCDESANAIERRGHAKGVSQDGYGRLCMTAAISYACHNEHPREWLVEFGHIPEDFVVAAVAGQLGRSAHPLSLQTWNDEIATKADVITAFRDTAEALRVFDRRQITIDTQEQVSAPLHTDPRVVIPAPQREREAVAV